MAGANNPEERKGWLVVEDEGLVSMLIEDAISDLGLSVVGPATGVRQAMALLRTENPEGALLDVNLGGEAVYPVAELLAQRRIPFVFITGYGKSGVAPAWSNRPVLQKPFMPAQIQNLVRQMQEQPATLS